MLRRVDRGTHFSLVPMPIAESASLTPRRARAFSSMKSFLDDAELPRLLGDAFLLAVVMALLFLVMPFR